MRRAITPVRRLCDGGVNMCLATNNIRNAFAPYENGDILQIAMLSIVASHLGGAEKLPTVTPMFAANAAKALELTDYGLAVGNKADMVLLDCKVPGNTIIDIPERLFVIKNGRILAETPYASHNGSRFLSSYPQ